MVLRVLAWGLLGIVILLGIGLYSVNALIQAPYIRDQIVAQVYKTTGRTLTINGGMEVHGGLFPRLSVHDVSLSHDPAQADGQILQAKTLDLQIALLPLVFGDVVIDGLNVVGMTLHLTLPPKKHKNTSPTPTQNHVAPAPAPARATIPHLMIRNLSIQNSTILLTDARVSPPLQETLKLSTLTLTGQGQTYHLSLKGTLRQTPLSLSGTVEDALALISPAGQSSVTLTTTLADVTLRAEGLLIKRKGTLAQAEGALDLKASAWPKTFPELPNLPPLTIKAGFLYTPDALGWTDMHLHALGTEVTSNGTYRLPQKALDMGLQMNSAGSTDLAKQFHLPWLQKPFTLKTRMQTKGETITWAKLKATLGQGTVIESDGAMRWPTGAAAPTLIQADIRSPMVILEDLKPSPPPLVVTSPESEALAPKPQTPAAENPAPEAPMTTEASSWRQVPVSLPLGSGMRGVVTGRFDHIRETAKGLDLFTNGTLRATQQEALAVEAKGTFVGGGVITLLTSLTPHSPQTPTPQPEALFALLLNITHPNVGALLKTTGLSPAVQGGSMHMLAHVRGQGARVQNVLDSLSGDVTLGMGRTTVHSDALLSSFVPEDLARALLGDNKTLPVSCVATRWPFVQGVAHTPITLLESPAVRVWGTGTLDLTRNALAMTLTPTPKDPKLSLLAVPLAVTGPLNAPQVSLGKQGLDTLTGTVLSLIQTKGKAPAPLPANDDLCPQVLIPLKDGRFEVRGVSPVDPTLDKKNTKPLSKKDLLEGLRGLLR